MNCIGYVVLKGKIIGNDELGRVQKKAVAYEVQSQDTTKDLSQDGWLPD